MLVRKFLVECKLYFIGIGIVLFIGLSLMIILGKEGSFISLNTYHPFWLNVFFINLTFMGDGLFALCLIGLHLFYFKKKKVGFTLLNSFLISGLVVQVIKNLVDAPRPMLFFEAGTYLNFINDVSLANNSSFPSGHTATIFALATVFVSISKNRLVQLGILLIAIGVGYSRIYLAQHFLLDVLIGVVIGVVSGIFALYILPTFIAKLSFIKNIEKNIKKIVNNSPSNVYE